MQPGTMPVTLSRIGCVAVPPVMTCEVPRCTAPRQCVHRVPRAVCATVAASAVTTPVPCIFITTECVPLRRPRMR